ncbi:ribonuclease P protein component [Georgenia yuyongxinii]|uniref:Ribonuclease P protein component n=1 Tax=Georgenia yuyongxinii TaxID=2589797 RepID=A0A552WPZ7_9MICO|nr:ribonuclease P protein component [Georgenia yuyongxinii]TRW44846.1 ribonuclease P protein component [Georgenia yuyongxinii]
MLPTRHRMRRSDEFSGAVRRGARSGASRLVVHLRVTEEADREGAPVLVGFIVPKAVGIAVHRNRVKRRLRALMRERVTTLQPGTSVVVRALAAADGASSAELARDLDAGIAGARSRAEGRRAREQSRS